MLWCLRKDLNWRLVAVRIQAMILGGTSHVLKVLRLHWTGWPRDGTCLLQWKLGPHHLGRTKPPPPHSLHFINSSHPPRIFHVLRGLCGRGDSYHIDCLESWINIYSCLCHFGIGKQKYFEEVACFLNYGMLCFIAGKLWFARGIFFKGNQIAWQAFESISAGNSIFLMIIFLKESLYLSTCL